WFNYIKCAVMNLLLYFFFSSRRRHTRWPRDWSSDVCSSDLSGVGRAFPARRPSPMRPASGLRRRGDHPLHGVGGLDQLVLEERRSEERRVGKECRTRWATYL